MATKAATKKTSKKATTKKAVPDLAGDIIRAARDISRALVDEKGGKGPSKKAKEIADILAKTDFGYASRSSTGADLRKLMSILIGEEIPKTGGSMEMGRVHFVTGNSNSHNYTEKECAMWIGEGEITVDTARALLRPDGQFGNMLSFKDLRPATLAEVDAYYEKLLGLPKAKRGDVAKRLVPVTLT